jgi:hypothetical protein
MLNFSTIHRSNTTRVVTLPAHGLVPNPHCRERECSLRSSTARIPADSAAPEHEVRHRAANPRCRASSRVIWRESSVMATTGIPRRRGSSAIPGGRRPPGHALDRAATITSGRCAVWRRSAASLTSTSKPDTVSWYANLARRSSSSTTSSARGRLEPGCEGRSSRLSASGVRRPMTPRHTSPVAGMSVWFPTDAPWPLS